MKGRSTQCLRSMLEGDQNASCVWGTGWGVRDVGSCCLRVDHLWVHEWEPEHHTCDLWHTNIMAVQVSEKSLAKVGTLSTEVVVICSQSFYKRIAVREAYTSPEIFTHKPREFFITDTKLKDYSICLAQQSHILLPLHSCQAAQIMWTKYKICHIMTPQ